MCMYNNKYIPVGMFRVNIIYNENKYVWDCIYNNNELVMMKLTDTIKIISTKTINYLPTQCILTKYQNGNIMSIFTGSVEYSLLNN